MAYTQILVEGPDCSGKSTLVERIKNTLHWDAKSLHHRDGDQFARYLREYSAQDHIVFDRGHMSEAVYGKLWRGGNPFITHKQILLDGIVAQRMMLIICLPEPETLRARYRSRQYPQQIKLDELERAHNLFSQYTDAANINNPHLALHLKPIIYRSKDKIELQTLMAHIEDQAERC